MLIKLISIGTGSGAPIWFPKEFEKKFQSPGYPSIANIDTRFAESTPSLKNFSPIPGL